MFPFKRIILFLLLVLLNISSRAGAFEEQNGIGTVQVFPYNFFSIDFWKGPSIEKPFVYDEISFLTDTSRVLRCQFSSTGSDSIPAWFDPQEFVFTKQEKIFLLTCVSRKDNWCEVIVNKKTGVTKWVELGFDVTFGDWQTFLPKSKSIEIVKGDSLLFETPTTSSISSPINLNWDHSYKQEMHCMQVQGMWMQIEITELNEFGGIINKRNGWIRWRDENEMFVQYFV
jgi:hypothetical protein